MFEANYPSVMRRVNKPMAAVTLTLPTSPEPQHHLSRSAAQRLCADVLESCCFHRCLLVSHPSFLFLTCAFWGQIKPLHLPAHLFDCAPTFKVINQLEAAKRGKEAQQTRLSGSGALLFSPNACSALEAVHS